MVFVTGDAYVDHPSFAMALLGRVLEAEGFRVAILSQPDWRSADAWRTFGRPRLCFAVSAGNMDSMLNHYTAAQRSATTTPTVPTGSPAAGRIGPRWPTVSGRGRRTRACRSSPAGSRPACGGWPITTIGATRSAARSCWTPRPDLVVYGMGERPLVEIVKRLAAGESVRQLRDVRGVAYRLGASEANDECGMMMGVRRSDRRFPPSMLRHP